MKQRRLHKTDIELTLEHGEWWMNEDDLWICELDFIRVVVREDQEDGVIITAIRMKGGER